MMKRWGSGMLDRVQVKMAGKNGTDGEGGDGEGKTGLVTKTRPKTKRPSLYKVLLLNDDYTPMELVVHVLERFFNKGREDATRIMLHVHHKGVGICGVFTYEIAETKVAQVMDFARQHQHREQVALVFARRAALVDHAQHDLVQVAHRGLAAAVAARGQPLWNDLDRGLHALGVVHAPFDDDFLQIRRCSTTLEGGGGGSRGVLCGQTACGTQQCGHRKRFCAWLADAAH